MAAQMKLRRAREAEQALKDSEVDRVAVLAKTARLRAARLALAADARAKNRFDETLCAPPSSPAKCGKRELRLARVTPTSVFGSR